MRGILSEEGGDSGNEVSGDSDSTEKDRSMLCHTGSVFISQLNQYPLLLSWLCHLGMMFVMHKQALTLAGLCSCLEPSLTFATGPTSTYQGSCDLDYKES